MWAKVTKKTLKEESNWSAFEANLFYLQINGYISVIGVNVSKNNAECNNNDQKI